MGPIGLMGLMGPMGLIGLIGLMGLMGLMGLIILNNVVFCRFWGCEGWNVKKNKYLCTIILP